MFHIRAVQETDDFEAICQLIDATTKRFYGMENMSYGMSGEDLKRKYRNSKHLNKGFVAIVENNIIMFMSVSTARATKNAYMECGFLPEYEEMLSELLDKCIATVRENGGSRIYKHSPILFGQVRNKGITLWEKLGFTSDEYSYVTTLLDIDNWAEPNSFDSTGIEPTTEVSYEQIKQILIQDDEDEMAELFQNQYTPNKSLNEVVLTLRDKSSDDISAIAYYRVNLFKLDKESESFEASAFGIHVRPQFSLDNDEIRRFLQGALISMKQLDVKTVISRITLKNFDVFSAMIKEGFNNCELEKANTIRLYKEI